MERNVDKIKRLEYELGRWQKKVAEQQAEIDTLRKERQTSASGLRQLNRAADALAGAMAVAYGEEAPEGTYTIRLPAFSLEGMGINFTVHASKDFETGEYVIKAMQNPPAPKDTECQEGGEKA